MLSATDLRKGHVIEYKNQLWIVLDATHITPGNLRGFVRGKIRSLQTGASIEERFSSDQKFEQAFIEQKEAAYSYEEQANFIFIDPKSYEQIFVGKNLVSEEEAKWLSEGMKVTLNLHDGNPISISLPPSVELKVMETEPYLKGATISNVFKPAKLENGITVQVPPFIEQGEIVRVSPSEGKYLERASKK